MCVRTLSSLLPIRFLIAAMVLPSAVSQLCEPLAQNSWDGLKDAIAFSFDFAILCPFKISDDGCPSNRAGYMVESPDLFIMCDSFLNTGEESACVIDCPGTHFTIAPFASLTLDGITLRGSKDSAIRVRENGMFTSYSSVFLE